MNQIATAAEEQTATTNEISRNIQQVAEVVMRTTNEAENTAAAAADLARQSVAVQALVQRFKMA